VAPWPKRLGYASDSSDDPPAPVLAGYPCIFGNFEGYRRAMEIANSPTSESVCAADVARGGKQLTGKDPDEMIRYFGATRSGRSTSAT